MRYWKHITHRFPIHSWKSNMVLNNNIKFTFGLKNRVIYEISIILLVRPKLFIVLKEVDFVIEMRSIWRFFLAVMGRVGYTTKLLPIFAKLSYCDIALDKSFQLCRNWWIFIFRNTKFFYIVCTNGFHIWVMEFYHSKYWKHNRFKQKY